MTTDFLELVSQIGNLIHREWTARNFAEDQFPSLCARALADLGAEATFSPDMILDWITKDRIATGIQKKHDFSQLQLTLFNEERFYIELLTWTDGLTTIHEHSFSGAFMVLAGSSLHSSFDFTVDRKINSNLHLGHLKRTGIEVLRKNDVRPIHSGDRFVHSAFHLDKPTCTLVIRTHIDYAALPQRDFKGWNAGLASSHFTLRHRQCVQMLHLCGRMNTSALPSRLSETVAGLDLTSKLVVLDKIYPTLRREVAQDLDHALGETTDGALIVHVLHEERRRKLLAKLKHGFEDAADRLMIGAAIFIRDPEEARAFLSEHVGDADARLGRMIRRLDTEAPAAIREDAKTYLTRAFDRSAP